VHQVRRRKRVIPRSFPDITGEEWIEIYNALDDAAGVQRKLPPDGIGMESNEKRQARLTEIDWIEIYLAAEDKYKRLVKDGDHGDGFISRENMREWKRQMRSIMVKLEVVRANFIGRKAVRA